MENNESNIGEKILDAFMLYRLKEYEYRRKCIEHELIHGLIQKLPVIHIDEEKKALIISNHRELDKDTRQKKKEYMQAEKQYEKLIKDIEEGQKGELLGDYVSRHKMEEICRKFYSHILAIEKEATSQGFLLGAYRMFEKNTHILSEIEERNKEVAERIEERIKTIESNM